MTSSEALAQVMESSGIAEMHQGPGRCAAFSLSSEELRVSLCVAKHEGYHRVTSKHSHTHTHTHAHTHTRTRHRRAVERHAEQAEWIEIRRKVMPLQRDRDITVVSSRAAEQAGLI